MFRAILVRAFSLLVLTLTIVPGAGATILPPNDLYLQDVPGKRSNVSQARFDAVIERANEIFSPIVAKHGGSLLIRGQWDDSTVNANAAQRLGSWIVTMYGGLARRDEVSADGFTLVLCHEIGHHLAGFPFVSSWSADEGQADYFSTLHCTHLMWGDDESTNALARETVDDIPRAKCNETWSGDNARNLCYRTMNAAKSLSNLLAALKRKPVDFAQPDPAEVAATFDGHPAPQCRLDTYVAGALCTTEFDSSVIPGKRNGRGYNDREAEEEAARYSCTENGGQSIGARPRCWFKPAL